MGPVNWTAVFAAALAAAVVVLALRRGTNPAVAALGMLVSAAMLGHALARIGPEVLAAKPWLYPMQSGGLAIAFVAPALFIAGSRSREKARETTATAGAILLAYLAMGAVFWALS